MLKSIRIINYALISNLNIEFNDGYVVFTGETGSGKSIIVGALNCLSGGRADSSVVKKGCDKAIIEGIFSLNERMKKILIDNDFEVEDEIIIRRSITSNGKSTIRLNDNAITLGFLNNLLKDEIDIHSQKENAYLLANKNHLTLLDYYVDDKVLIDNYHDAYKTYTKAQKQFDDFLNQDYNLRDLDFYQYSLNELEQANLSIEEEEELQIKEKRIKNLQKSLSGLQNAISLYFDDEGIKERLYDLKKALGDNDEIIDIATKVNDIYYELDDEMNKLSDIYNNFDISEEEINHIEERLYVINRLKRKYSMDIQQLVAYQDELADKIAQFENRDKYILEKQEELTKLKNDASAKALALSKLRKQKALELEKLVIKELNDLLLPNAKFKINFIDQDLSSNGIDEVEFYITLNKGEDLKPLIKVASGGEMSRLMLGLKTIFSTLNQTSLLVFDEIDNGVSGQVAYTIGKKMQLIAKDCQVLTITHLAPVASFANQHLYIYKDDANGLSQTHIRELDKDERIKELAMISSSNISEQSISAARELLERASNENN